MNVRLLRRIAKVIQDRPKEFSLKTWHKHKKTNHATGILSDLPSEDRVGCGTTHCIGGWAQVLSRHAAKGRYALDEARRVLGLSEEQALRLFCGDRWPDGFGQWHPTAKQAAARIERFIKTKGAE